MTARDPDVDAYLDRAERWQAVMRKLRGVLLECGLDEALKWKKPCYVHGGKNVAIVQPFRGHCALLFFKGALLEDTHGLLRSQGPNTRSAMRLEFTSEAEVRKAVVKAYVNQAVQVEREGRSVAAPPRAEPEWPAELNRALRRDRALAQAWRALTPGRRRGYVIHFNSAKQSATRAARVERCAPKILAGKGMHDR